MFSRASGRGPTHAQQRSRVVLREIEEERAWFARKARLFQETQERQRATRDQIISLLQDVGQALDSVAEFVCANTEAAQAAKKRAGELTVALDQVTRFMSGAGECKDDADETALPPILAKKLAELEERHARATTRREEQLRSVCDRQLEEMRKAVLKAEIERDSLRETLASERELAPKMVEEAVAEAVADAMEREASVHERKVNEAVALALSVERKKAASGLGGILGLRSGNGLESNPVGDESSRASRRDDLSAIKSTVASLKQELKEAHTSLEMERSARERVQAEAERLKEDLKVISQDAYVAKQNAKEKIRRMRSKIEEYESAAQEKASADADHDQVKRDFRNYKRQAVGKMKKAMDALREEHEETVQSLRDEHRRQLNRAYQKNKEEKEKYEKMLRVASDSADASTSAGVSLRSRSSGHSRSASGPVSKKHRRTGTNEMTDVAILKRRVELEQKEKEKKKREIVMKKGMGKRGTLIQQKNPRVGAATTTASSSSPDVIPETPPPKEKFHRSKHSVVLSAVSEALDVGKDSINHPVGRREKADNKGSSDTLAVNTDNGGVSDDLTPVPSPGTPGGFSDCEDGAGVEELDGAGDRAGIILPGDEDEGENTIIDLGSEKPTAKRKKNFKKQTKKASAAVKNSAKKMGSAAKKVGSAAKKKMGKLFKSSRKKEADLDAGDPYANSPPTPESREAGSVENSNRDRSSTFDSLEAKLSRWESMGEM